MTESSFKERVEALQSLFDVDGEGELNREEFALLTSCLLHGVAGLTQRKHLSQPEIKIIAQNVLVLSSITLTLRIQL